MGRYMTADATAPAYDAASITPHDTNTLTKGSCRALYVGGAGNVKITTPLGTEITFTSVPVGVFPVQAKIVWSTGTTATNLIALY